jgi:tripartite-type tricarboxylate transporter receptor subunit TctC
MKVAKWSFVAGIVLLSLAAPTARAETRWPAEKTVRIVVPFAAGGIGDVLMRLLAQEVGDKANRTIIVENRPGAGGVIGTESVSRSLPDGTNLLLVANSFLINAHVAARLPYDVLTSFAPICLLAHTPMVLVVNTKSRYLTFAEFIEAAREPQNRLTIGGTGPNTTQHLALEALKQATNADLSFVSFSGDPPAVTNVLSGHITAALANYAGVKDHLGAGLRPLAVGSYERLAELPDVPSLSELGFTEIDAIAWIGLVLPARTPEDITAQIATHFHSALDVPGIRTKLKALGLTPIGKCGEDFASYLRQQYDRYGRVVKAAGIKAQ